MTRAAGTSAEGFDLGQAETLIEETELALQRLGEELASATAAQHWERVRALKQEYEDTQSRLEALLQRWEALAVA